MSRSVVIAPVLAALALGAASAQGVAPALPERPAVAAPPPDAPMPNRDARLDALFARLADAEGRDAGVAAHGIQALWSQSGSDAMDFLLSRGRAALEAEDYDKAVQHFTALVELAPAFAEGWNMRATAHFLNDELWLSMADIQRTLALEPRHFGALSGMAAIFSRIGAADSALEAARAALAVNPHLEQAREMEKELAPKVDGRRI